MIATEIRSILSTGFLWAPVLCAVLLSGIARGEEFRLKRDDYRDRTHAIWAGQVIGMYLAYPFEHRTGSVVWVDDFRQPTSWQPEEVDYARVDDDWYYEIVALRGFEQYGVDMTVEQLGRRWLADSAGTWGSSAETRRLLLAGHRPPDTGHPRYNPLWYTIGPQFSADIYGAVAPGMPNVAGRLARQLGHINGYAEGADGGVFVAGMVSLAFTSRNTRQCVRNAATLIHPSSPYRECLATIIEMADKGATFEEVSCNVADRWHLEYPATNNAVANGGFVAAGLWFGEGDFMTTMNMISSAADFTDSDCNAANAGAVLGAMYGTKCLPPALLRQFKDRIRGDSMGQVKYDPPVDERISDLARRTAAVGEKIVMANGARIADDEIIIPVEPPATQQPERFQLANLMQYWNRDWELHGAGFGYGGRVRGTTRLDGEVLSTYPRDEVRGVSLRRRVGLGDKAMLSFEAGVDADRAWLLNVWVDNRQVFERLIEGDGTGRHWDSIRIDLSAFARGEVHLRVYQQVLGANIRLPGSAYWRDLSLTSN